MKKLSLICSLLLISIGLYGYLAWEKLGATSPSITALIPTFIGVVMFIGTLVANRNNKLGMHISVTASLLGALAGLGRLIPGLIKGSVSLAAATPQLILIMTVICTFFTIMAVRSFIAARRGRA